MNILVNDEPYQAEDELCLCELLQRLDLRNRRGWAFAVNGEVVPQSQVDSFQLKDGDELLLIQATQGG